MNAPAAKTVVRVDFAAEMPRRRDGAPLGRVPRVVRHLALAHRIDRMVRDGEIADYADAARRLGLTRARVTQITNLLLLSPEIQTEILDLPPVAKGRDPVSERRLLRVDGELEEETAIKLAEGVAEAVYEELARLIP